MRARNQAKTKSGRTTGKRGRRGDLGRDGVVIVREHDVKLEQKLENAPPPALNCVEMSKREGIDLESAVHPIVLRQELSVHIQRKPEDVRAC